MDNENMNTSEDGSDPLLEKAIGLLAMGKVTSICMMIDDQGDHSVLIRLSPLPATPRSGSSEP
jgi:hypothetical protein